MSNSSPRDPELTALLADHGITPDALLGSGGEAAVYALDDERVIRVCHEDGGDIDRLRSRSALVDELRTDAVPYELPRLLEIEMANHRAYAIEQRLPGRSVSGLLLETRGADRAALIESHLDAAASLGRLSLKTRPWFGELLNEDPIRTATWSEYLRRRVRRSLSAAPEGFAMIDADTLADALPDCAVGRFVHLDAFSANMLATAATISAVIDIGPTSVVGDPVLDAVSAVVYFCSSPITPAATARDRKVARSWLRNHDLDDRYDATRRWLAAYWSWAVDDTALHTWCREVLLT